MGDVHAPSWPVVFGLLVLAVWLAVRPAPKPRRPRGRHARTAVA